MLCAPAPCARTSATASVTGQCRVTKLRLTLLECKPHLDLVMLQIGNRRRLDQGTTIDHALVPVGKVTCLIEPFDVAPIGLDEVAVPLVQLAHAHLVHELHAEPRGFELVCVQNRHETGSVLSVLQVVELVLERGSHPLNRVTEQMEQEETLHLEANVRVDDDPESVEDASTGRFEVAIFEDESTLDD